MGDILEILETMVSGVGDFLDWIPKITSFAANVDEFAPPFFVPCVTAILAIYLIKVVLGAAT